VILYADNNATTAVDPRVLDAMLPALREIYGNPSSLHAAGEAAGVLVDKARAQVAALVGCPPSWITFTSGGTESDNLALRGRAAHPAGRHIVTTAVEHPAILETCAALANAGFAIDRVGTDANGHVDATAFAPLIREDTTLVTVMAANNETGVELPIDAIGAICRARGVPFHVDAVQAAGKLSLDMANRPIDLLTISGHKLHGPKGVGALAVRPPLKLGGMTTGGGQEKGRRSGTLNVPGIVGLGAACRLALDAMAAGAPAAIAALRDRLQARFVAEIADIRINGTEPRTCNTLNVSFLHTNGEALLLLLSQAGICVSTGSACSAGSPDPSHVLVAMGLDETWLQGTLRFSLSRLTTADEVERIADETRAVVERLRSLAPR
jgi:cysteine desulfurase